MDDVESKIEVLRRKLNELEEVQFETSLNGMSANRSNSQRTLDIARLRAEIARLSRGESGE